MSYSYVTSVFPNFKYSNVYNTKLYETVDLKDTERTSIPAWDNEQNSTLAQVEQQTKEQTKEQTKTQTKEIVEEFQAQTSEHNSNVDYHLEYTKHILSCASCKQVLIKQFNIDNDRIKNEEIMELISFIMFGIFILILLDGK